MITSINLKITTTLLALFLSLSSFAWNTPTQVTPANNAQTWNEVEFTWTPVVNSLAYQFQIDTSTLFNSSLIHDTTIAYVSATGYSDCHVLMSQLYFGTIYNWRVRAYTATDTSAWSPVWSITTKDYVTPSAPLTGDQTFTKVLLDWDSHVGVNFYEIQLDTTTSFNSTALQTATEVYFSNLSTFYDTEKLFQNLYYGKAYFWRVRAINSIDTSAWSMETFTTKPTVNLTGPTAGSTEYTGATIDWTSFEGSHYYDYQIDINQQFNSANLVSGSKLYMGTGSGNSDTEFFADDLEFGQQYYWRVRARNGVDTSVWIMSDFTTENTVYLNSPANNSTTECAVTFDWLAHAGVNFYEYQVDETSAFNSPNLISGQNTYINHMDENMDTEIEISSLNFDTEYFWRVRAHNATGTSNWSETRKITTLSTIELTSPNHLASTFTAVNFDWEDFDGCTLYQMQIDTSLGFNSTLLSLHASGISEKEIHQFHFGWNYYWRVRGISSTDTSSWSETRKYYTYNQVGLFTPTDSALSLNENGVYLDWWYHLGAFGYQLEIDTTNTFDSPNLLHENIPYQFDHANGPDTEYTTDTLLDDQFYFWRVRAINEVDTSRWEERWFSTGEDVLNLPDAPQLQTPLMGQMEVAVNPIINWSDITGAAGYRYQYDVSPDFNNPIAGYVTNSEAQILNLQFATTYYWRARTHDGSFLSPWSEPFQFTTEQETLSPPQLIFPADGTTDMYVQNVNLDWDDVYHSQKYLVEYASDANFLFNNFTDTVIASEHLAFGFEPQTTYYWHVKSLNDSLNNSDWSDTWTFATTLALDIPILVSPADLSSGLGFGHVSLDWDDVPMVDFYEVQSAHDLNFTMGVEIHSTPETYFIMSNLEPLTTYFWKVKAKSDTLYDSEFTSIWRFTTGTDTVNSISEINPDEISIFPNPSQGDVWIALPNENEQGSITVYNSVGKLIATNTIDPHENPSYINIEHYPEGIYIVRIVFGSLILNKKIVHQKQRE